MPGYDASLDGPADKPGKGRKARKTAENLEAIAEYDGNLADHIKDEKELKRLGEEVVREFEHDEKSREEWTQGVDRALKNARQKPEKKMYPFEGASNIKYPVLTKAAVQFNSRCSSAIFRSEQPLTCKVLGNDTGGLKSKKASRLRGFGNHQLMYMIDEWAAGTDKLTLMLPVMGSGFRKGYWRQDRGNPALEFTSAKNVVAPNDAPSFDRSPRLTQPCIYYPYEVDRLISSKKWLDHKRDYEGQKDEDSQKACQYLEQQRYIDLDGDGLMEPYIVTVSKDHREVVRIDPAFYADSIRISSRDGKVETVLCESPWIDYTFIPDIEGSVYGMGFGQFLESVGNGINTALNQIFDAAHRQNAGGGFISQGLRLRGGEVRVRPSEFLNVNIPGRVSDAIHELQFEGPSPVLFQLVEFLLGAADDITSVKDVMTGEAPSGQAMGATLALIEQGQQVLSTIYERIYRSMRKEFRLLFRLNQRYLDPGVYAEYLDDQELFAELMGLPAPGSEPQPEGMAQGAPQPTPDPIELDAAGLEKLVADFDLKSMDVAPTADPRSFTDMQRMMQAQYLDNFLMRPGMDPVEISKRQLDAANVPEKEKLFLKGPSPIDQLNARGATATVEKTEAERDLTRAQVKTEEQKTVKTAKEADKAYEDASTTAFNRGVAEGMGGGLPGVENSPDDGMVLPEPADPAGGAAAGMGEGPMGIGNGPPAGATPPA